MFPSFTATQSALQEERHFGVTTVGFIPILPYVATDLDSIYTSMVNFQDILIQRDSSNGAIWCDEGIYQLAKEIQLLKPEQFGNLFIGLGGFHMEKIIIACLGRFLEHIGVDSVLVEADVFGENVVGSLVMGGGHYIKGKGGLSLIAEAITALQIEQFEFECDTETDLPVLLNNIATSQNNPHSTQIGKFRECWEQCKTFSGDFYTSFLDYKKLNSEQNSDNFLFWDLFLHELYPILRDMTHSFRTGNWTLHISAVRRALPLFFAFGRTNYSRWVSLYFEVCLDVQRRFPELHKCFIKGGFVMYYNQRQGRAIPLNDQALEKCYNKPAKVSDGIIGVTRRKEAVALWNITKHQKDLYVTRMKSWCGLNEDDEFSLHHEFNSSSSLTGLLWVSQVIEYIKSIANPFDIGEKL